MWMFHARHKAPPLHRYELLIVANYMELTLLGVQFSSRGDIHSVV